MKREVAALLLLGCIGCGTGAADPPLPTVDFEQTVSMLALPESDSGQAAESPPLAQVLIMPSLMLLSDEPHPLLQLSDKEANQLAQVGLPARAKRNSEHDLMLSQLYISLDHRRAASKEETAASKPYILILADKSLPYRVLTELAYTSQRVSLPIHIGVADKGKAIPIAIPPMGSTRPMNPRYNLTVVVTGDGITVKTGVGQLATGCREPGRGVTVPKQSDKHDYAGLASCIKRTILKNDGRTGYSTLVAPPQASLQTVVSALDAMRGPEHKQIDAVSLGVGL